MRQVLWAVLAAGAAVAALVACPETFNPCQRVPAPTFFVSSGKFSLVDQPVTVTISAQESECFQSRKGALSVRLRDPNENLIAVTLSLTGDDAFSFTPRHEGVHHLEVFFTDSTF